MEMPHSKIELLSENHAEISALYKMGMEEKAFISLTVLTKEGAEEMIENLTSDLLLLNFHEVSEEKA